MAEELKQETELVPENDGGGKFSEEEVQQLRAILQLFPTHNHDGRNSLEVATKKVRASITSQRVSSPSDIVSGEAISNGDSLRISSKSEFVLLAQEDGTRADGTALNSGDSCAQSFTLSGFDATAGSGCGITGVTFYYALASSANKTVRASIYNDSGGSPGSTEHAFEEKNVADGVTDGSVRFTFNGFIPTVGVTYWIVIKAANTTSQLKVRRLSGVNNYTNKVNTGSWAADGNTNDFWFQIHYLEASENRVFKATSLSNDMGLLFVGVATGDASAAGQSIEYLSFGTKTDYSGLSTGDVYYLTDTAGDIANAAGRFTVPIGKAISSQILFVQPPALG